MVQKIETVIIGGGQAGLAVSYYLNRLSRENIILEQSAMAGNAWRNDRWDSFTLLTPNWSFRLPGAQYQGKDPGGFMPRDEIVANFEQYVTNFHLPVQYNVQVNSVQPNVNSGDYLVTSEDSTWEAHNVVIATGLFQSPKIPAFSSA